MLSESEFLALGVREKDEYIVEAFEMKHDLRLQYIPHFSTNMDAATALLRQIEWENYVVTKVDGEFLVNIFGVSADVPVNIDQMSNIEMLTITDVDVMGAGVHPTSLAIATCVAVLRFARKLKEEVHEEVS